MKFRTCLLILLPALMSPAATARPLEVLFIGNSYVYVNDLPQVFRQVAAGAGQEAPHVAMHAPGGQTLSGHCRDAGLLKKLQARFDVVIFQEQSQMPALAETNPAVRRQFLEACRWLTDYIHQRQPATRIILLQTWARHASAWRLDPSTAEMGADPGQMQARLSRWYAEAGRQARVQVAPVGDVWLANYHSPHPVMLHVEDGSHPAPAGTYLTALVLESVIYQIPAVTRYAGSLDPGTALRLQALVRSALPMPATSHHPPKTVPQK